MDTSDVEEEYAQRLADIAINECCCLVYTSGTVGNPKGVMLNHDNLTWDAYTIGCRLENLQMGNEILISYLPLSHVAAQIVDIFLTLSFACTIYFADKDALKGSLVKTLSDVNPTRFLGVPRVYEKIQEKMMAVAAQSGPVKRFISSWAKGVTLQHYLDRMEGKQNNSLQYKIVKNLFLAKVKSTLGLSRCVSMVSAAAPISPDVKKCKLLNYFLIDCLLIFKYILDFMSLDMPLNEAFGMSETSGGHSLTTSDTYNFETIGKGLSGTQTKIMNPNESGHGEICLKGRHIFMGYIGKFFIISLLLSINNLIKILDDPEKTKEAKDDDGWLHTGDIGYVDDKELIYITGRIKELIITAGGENIPPVHIEHMVLNELSVLSNAFLVGDKRKFLTMLVSLKTEMEIETGAPKDELHPETLKWLQDMDLTYTKLSEVLAAGPDKKVRGCHFHYLNYLYDYFYHFKGNASDN